MIRPGAEVRLGQGSRREPDVQRESERTPKAVRSNGRLCIRPLLSIHEVLPFALVILLAVHQHAIVSLLLNDADAEVALHNLSFERTAFGVRSLSRCAAS